jgi:hypothetical protein
MMQMYTVTSGAKFLSLELVEVERWVGVHDLFTPKLQSSHSLHAENRLKNALSFTASNDERSWQFFTGLNDDMIDCHLGSYLKAIGNNIHDSREGGSSE